MRYGVVGILLVKRLQVWFNSHVMQNIILLSEVLEPALGPTQRPTLWKSEDVHVGVKPLEHHLFH